MNAKPDDNRFQDFFEEAKYLTLKNYLYNYLIRKRAVEKVLAGEKPVFALEVGSGISPVLTNTHRIVYSDLSFTALRILKTTHGKGWYVAADGMNLPFKSGAFSHIISSEVLEHLGDDRKALGEIARVMRAFGRLVLTVPHRKKYFSNDDRFVNHFRRYEIPEITDRLEQTGFKAKAIRKVLGPLEKATMSFTVFCFSKLRKMTPEKENTLPNRKLISLVAPVFKWANLLFMGAAMADARIMPRTLSTVLLIDCVRSADQKSGCR